MGKKSEKDYITYSEWTNDFGGAKPKNLGASSEFKRLPFSCCTLSLKLFEVPVCTVEGEIFDFMQIIPYLRKNENKHPYKGTDLKPSDLIRLNFQKNDQGDFYCPITRKTFNEYSKIVANRKTGNVFSWEAIETLNIEKNNWKDLITEESFSREDLIILQDPQNPKNHSEIIKKAQAEKIAAEIRDVNKISDRVNLSGGIGKVLRELKMIEIPSIQSLNDSKLSEQSPDALHALAPHTTGKMAASLTSTSMALKTSTELAVLDEAETLARYFPEGKETTGTVCIRTNFGDLFFTLFASKSPRCCYNFIELTKAGYYDNVQFHRFIKGFILQGGDPTGTGRGGESCWKKPFGERLFNNSSLTHNERGMLSMANAGDPNANGSQFFITLRPAPHLNGKHPVFGKLLAGGEVLDKIEDEVEVDVNSGPRPLTPITITDVFVLEDPFEEAKNFALKQSIEKSKSVPISTVTSQKNNTTKIKSKVPQIGKYLTIKPRGK